MTTPLAAASTGVFSGTMKSIAFRGFPVWAGEDVLSILSNEFLGTDSPLIVNFSNIPIPWLA